MPALGRIDIRLSQLISAERAWPHLGRRHRSAPEGLSGRCGSRLPRLRARPPGQEPCARREVGIGGEDAGDGALAHAELAAGHQGAAEGPLRGRADQGGRRAASENRRHWTAASAGRGGLVDRRTSLEWRAGILPLEPARRHFAHAPGRRDQRTPDLRAGASAVEGGTRTRPLRGTIMDGAPSARAHDHDRLCLPPIPAPQAGEAEKKEARARPLSRSCRQSAPPSSPHSNSHPQRDVRIVADGSAPKFRQSSDRAGNSYWRKPDADGCGLDGGEVVVRVPVASGCDAAPVLEAAEDALDHIAPSIGAPHPEPAARAVGIMGRVGEQPSCGGARVPQRNGDVGDIARGQRDGDRSAPVIGRAADLRGPPALRPADGFLPRLLLEPAAARCAFTWVLSMERSSGIAPAAAIASNSLRQTPRADQRLKRLQMVVGG